MLTKGYMTNCPTCKSVEWSRHCNKKKKQCTWLVCKLCGTRQDDKGNYFKEGKR